MSQSQNDDDFCTFAAPGSFVVPTAEEIIENIRRLSALVRSNVRPPSGTQEWTRIRSNQAGWADLRSPHLEFHFAPRPYRWPETSRPHLHQQVVLRAESPGAGDAPTELQETRCQKEK